MNDENLPIIAPLSVDPQDKDLVRMTMTADKLRMYNLNLRVKFAVFTVFGGGAVLVGMMVFLFLEINTLRAETGADLNALKAETSSVTAVGIQSQIDDTLEALQIRTRVDLPDGTNIGGVKVNAGSAGPRGYNGTVGAQGVQGPVGEWTGIVSNVTTFIWKSPSFGSSHTFSYDPDLEMVYLTCSFRMKHTEDTVCNGMESNTTFPATVIHTGTTGDYGGACWFNEFLHTVTLVVPQDGIAGLAAGAGHVLCASEPAGRFEFIGRAFLRNPALLTDESMETVTFG